MTQKQPFDKDAACAWIDGASSGNPGPAGVGVVIKKNGKTIGRFTEFLGETTNNVAEYKSLMLAIRKSVELGIKRLLVYTDSQLLYRQLTGRYRIRNPSIKQLYEEVRLLLGGLKDFRIRHIPREQNREADKLAREARRQR